MAVQAAAPDAGLVHLASHAAAVATAVPAAIGGGSALAFATPARSGALPSAAGGLLRVALALIVVLAAIFGAGWLSRRVHGTGKARHPGLEVLAQLPLGPRERAVLIRVGAQQLLVGVAGGCIRTLHVCVPDAVSLGEVPVSAAMPVSAAPQAALSATDAGTTTTPTFKSLLLKSLGK